MSKADESEGPQVLVVFKKIGIAINPAMVTAVRDTEESPTVHLTEEGPTVHLLCGKSYVMRGYRYESVVGYLCDDVHTLSEDEEGH